MGIGATYKLKELKEEPKPIENNPDTNNNNG